MKLININSEGIPYFEGDINPTKVKDIYSQVVHKHRIFVAETTVPEVYMYGAVQLTDEWEHKAGYVWSSRPGFLNELFGECFVDIRYNNCTYAMKASDLEDYLSDEYYISRSFSGGEPNYKVKKKEVLS